MRVVTVVRLLELCRIITSLLTDISVMWAFVYNTIWDYFTF